MKIAVDGSKLDSSYFTGTHLFLLNFLVKLVSLDTLNSYELVVKKGVSKKLYSYKEVKNCNIKITELESKYSFTQVDLCRYVNNNYFDAIFCSFHTVPVFLSKNVRVLSFIHDLYIPFFLKGPTIYTLYKSDLIFVPSEFVKSKILKTFHINSNRVIIIYEGINLLTDDIFVRDFIKKLIKNRYVFYIGNDVKRKNLENMLLAFKYYKAKSDSDMKFVISGDISPITKNFCDKHAIKDVIFTGYINENEKNLLLENMEFLYFVTNEEGFGIPVLEALYKKKSALVSNTGAVVELFKDYNVKSVNPKNIESITKGLWQLIEYGEKDINGNVSKHFNWDITCRKFLDGLNTL